MNSFCLSDLCSILTLLVWTWAATFRRFLTGCCCRVCVQRHDRSPNLKPEHLDRLLVAALELICSIWAEHALKHQSHSRSCSFNCGKPELWFNIQFNSAALLSVVIILFFPWQGETLLSWTEELIFNDFTQVAHTVQMERHLSCLQESLVQDCLWR